MKVGWPEKLFRRIRFDRGFAGQFDDFRIVSEKFDRLLVVRLEDLAVLDLDMIDRAVRLLAVGRLIDSRSRVLSDESCHSGDFVTT